MKKQFLNSLLVLILICFVNFESPANEENLKAGKEYFFNNDFTNAALKFELASGNPATMEEAYLYLSLIHSSQYTYEKAQYYFRKFCGVSKNYEPYMMAMFINPSVSNGFGKKNEDVVEFFESLLENETLNVTLRGHIYEMLGRHYNASNDFERADEYLSQIGSIDKWLLVGEFRNISESGFDKNYAPVTNPKPSSTFKNKNDAEVKWFKLVDRRPGEWISLSNNFYIKNSIVFAQTFCMSPTDRDVILRIGTSGSLKAWVNDNLAISESEERDNGLDTYMAKVKLKKGYNRILLQLGASGHNRSNFIARITDTQGNLLPDLEYYDSYYEYTEDKSYKPEIIPLSSEVFFEKKVKEEPDNILNYFFLAESYLGNDKSYEARKTINKAQKLAPKSSFLVRQMMDVHVRDRNKTGLSMEIERLKEIAPESSFALDYLFDDAIDNEDYDKAKEILKKLSDAYGKDNLLVILKESIILAKEEKNDKLYDLIDRAYELYPEDPTVVYLKYKFEQGEKNYDDAIDILEEFLDNNYTYSTCQALAISYLIAGEFKDGLELLDYTIEADPSSDGIYKDLGDLYFEIKDYETAIEYYNKALEISPYTGIYHKYLGQVYQDMYKNSIAIESYKKCIQYSPTNYEVRRKLRELEGEVPVFDYFNEPDYYEMYKNAPDADKYPEDNYLFILDEVQKVVYASGGSEEKHYILVKVFNSSGVDRWKDQYVPAAYNQDYLIEKAEVLKKDGNRIKAEVSRGHAVFTNLEEGDAILLIFKLENYQYDKLTKHFWDKHYFSFYAPYQLSKYSLLVEKGVAFKYKMLNSNLEPDIIPKSNFDLYVWEQENKESIKSESYMPGLSDIGEVLHLSTIPDWDWIAKWYSDISINKAKSDFEVQETVAELFEGKENLSDMEKISIIYNYIVKNIRYSSISFRQHGIIPQKASMVINTKMGDCKDVSTLFKAMCKEVGIEAVVVLVNTRSNGKYDLLLPSLDFEHAIVKTIIDGQEYYIEMTSDNNSFRTIGSELKKSFTLDIIDDANVKVEPKYIDPASRVENSIYRTATVTFKGDDATISKKNVRYGDWASSFRSTYRDLGTEAREKNLRESLASQHANLKINKFDIGAELDNTADSLIYSYEYTARNVFSKISNMNIYELPWSNSQGPKDFMSMDDRKYPVEFWKYKNDDVRSEEISINVPDGMELTDVPANLDYSCKIADYSLHFTLNNGVLLVTRVLKFKDDYVPLEDYNDFRSFFEKVIKADEQQIAFVAKDTKKKRK